MQILAAEMEIKQAEREILEGSIEMARKSINDIADKMARKEIEAGPIDFDMND